MRRRRELLQLRAARRQQASQAREIGAWLCDNGATRLSRLPATRVVALMHRYVGLALVDERVDWSAVDGHCRVTWGSAPERDATFVSAVNACFHPDARVVLVFHTHESALVAAARDVVEGAAMVLPVIKDTLWITPLARGTALVEVSYIDSEICWHPLMPGA